MEKLRNWQPFIFGDLGLLLFLANSPQGRHRDELDILDNARSLSLAQSRMGQKALTGFGIVIY